MFARGIAVVLGLVVGRADTRVCPYNNPRLFMLFSFKLGSSFFQEGLDTFAEVFGIPAHYLGT